MDFVEQIKGAVAGHDDEIKQGIESIGDTVDSATGSKFSAQVDQAQEFLSEQVEKLSSPTQ
jgi:hypothetical protein